MDRVRLVRMDESDHGTFGVIYFKGYELFSGELPWRDNEPNVSCIPVGIYQVRYTFSNAFKRYMYLVEGVEEREGIRIHSANFMGDKTLNFRSQLSGCISLGHQLGSMQQQKAVLLSKPAISFFELIMERKEFTLEIIDGTR